MQSTKGFFRRLSNSVGRQIARYVRLPRHVRQWQPRDARSLSLLIRWLSRDQLNQFETKGCFEVLGCDTGRRYRISSGAAMNVIELNESGDIGWCFVPEAIFPLVT
jgi:hypothetical protein